MTKTIKLTAVIVALLVADSVFAVVTEDDINRAYYAADTALLETLRTELDTANVDDAILAGYLDWRLASIHMGMADEDAADAALKRGQATLETAVEQAPDSAEAWALLSSTLGMRTGIRPMARGFTLGRKANAALDKALALEPNNPRVLVINGIAKLSTPALFGGGYDAAVESLDQAVAAVENNGSGRYAWGKADAYVWRGIASKKTGDTAAAIEDFDNALAVVPSYDWVKMLKADVSK